MNSNRLTRLVRGSAAAAISTFVALFGHVAGGGALPGWLGVVVPLVLSVAVCVPLANRRLSVVRISISVVVSQLLFHTLFVLGAAGAVATTANSHHGVATMISSSAAGHHMDASPAMWTGHAASALVTIAALVYGERAIRGLLRLARRVGERLAPRLVVDLAVPTRPRWFAAAPRRRVSRGLPRLSHPRRGPPHLASI